MPVGSSVVHSATLRTLVQTGSILCFILVTALPAPADDYRTPLAGESFHTELFGESVDVAPRDRRRVTSINMGIQWIPQGPTQLQLLPFGALYLWRNWDDGHRRFRGTFAGVFNDVNFNLGSRSLNGWELVFTLDNTIIPLGRSEYVEGQRIQDVEVAWSHVFGGIGIGYHHLLPPWHQDSAIEVTLTYEPGYRWFSRRSNTSPNFIVPTDTYEGRERLRLRVDALDRNLMELPHRGVALGGDLLAAQRAVWHQWGGVAFPNPNAQREKNYFAASGYAVLAGGVPFVHSERHRLIASLFGGVGKNLDRFSAFRLNARPTGYEWEALSMPMLPATAFNEFFPTRYGIADVTYRYEALFFLFPYVQATWAVLDRPRFGPGQTIITKTDALPALGTGIVSGAPWKSQVEVNYSYNFGVFRSSPDGPREGGQSIFVFWAKLL